MGNVLPGNNRINAALDRVIRHYTTLAFRPPPTPPLSTACLRDTPLRKPMTKTHYSSFHKTLMLVHDMGPAVGGYFDQRAVKTPSTYVTASLARACCEKRGPHMLPLMVLPWLYMAWILSFSVF